MWPQTLASSCHPSRSVLRHAQGLAQAKQLRFLYQKNFRSLKTLLEGTVLRPEAFHLGTEKHDLVGMHFHHDSVQSESL